MFDVIVACTKKFGIGCDEGMPWYCEEELALFRRKTENSVLIMGRKTVQSLPKLSGRYIICVTKNSNLDTTTFKNKCTTAKSVRNSLEIAKLTFPNRKIFVAGGAEIYNEALNEMPNEIENLHISFMHRDFHCTRYISFPMSNWVIKKEEVKEEFVHKVMKYAPTNGELQYLNVLNEVRYRGNVRKGRNGETRSLFTKHLSFDLRDGFPLLTTKKMFMRGIIEELLLFMNGGTDSKILEEKNVMIWKGNTDREFLDKLGMTERKEGVMGPMYGYQWRFFNATYDEENARPQTAGVDQLRNVINLIKNDPHSRRIMMTTFNPAQLHLCVLPPCHSIILQFYVDGEYLDMFCYNRSQDLFLGTPFNIASSSLLLTIIAKICNLTPRTMNITMGDAHIYEEHYEAVEKQISRRPYTFPYLSIEQDLNDIKDISLLKASDFKIVDYQSHSSIKAKMVA